MSLGGKMRQGQNLAMALAIAVMLGLTLPLTLSGYATYNEWGGGLAEDVLEELHELLGNAFLVVAIAHLVCYPAFAKRALEPSECAELATLGRR